MVLTRSEKERRIIEMYEAGHTIREIAREVHMSFGPIGNIIRKVTGDSGIDSKPIMSKETDALKLFHEGKIPVEVAIDLDISSDETEDLYLEYLKLVHLHHLVLIYKELKYQLPSFVKLYRILRIRGIKEEDAADLIKDAKQIPFLRSTFWDLTNANTNLEEQRNGKISELTNIQNEVERHKTYLEIGQHELNRINFEIMEKNRELQDLDRLIDDRMKEYIRYK
jgi:DNA-binding Lrp family transcriptional regulator